MLGAPNLTDDYWILGGGIRNVFKTISEGGRAGKGMVAWKRQLRPAELLAVSSYVGTLTGTEPPNPKAPQAARDQPPPGTSAAAALGCGR